MRNILIAMALVLAALPLRAQQWARTTGPEGAEIVSIASTDIMVLAITRPGVLHSFNGAEWRNLGPTDARQLYAVGNTYIALSSEGLSRSTDRGLHWQRTSITGSFLKVAIDDGMLYAADDSTIYRSGDQGLTWSVPISMGRT